jgi:hypothetical protein
MLNFHWLWRNQCWRWYKIKKPINAESYGGNPGFVETVVKLSNGIVIGFSRPIGECGAGITFFGIILPVIPVWFNLNNCEKNFVINISGTEVLNAKLKHNGVIYSPVAVVKKVNITHSWVLYGSLTEYKFQIPNFWKFRMAKDKAIIVTGKTKDGKEFAEELPVKWGIMLYKEWSFP